MNYDWENNIQHMPERKEEPKEDSFDRTLRYFKYAIIAHAIATSALAFCVVRDFIQKHIEHREMLKWDQKLREM